MTKYFKLLLVSIIGVMCGCSNGVISIQDAMNNAKIQYDTIHHVEEVTGKKILIVFYKQQNQLDTGLIQNKADKKKWLVGNITSLSDHKFTWTYSYLNQIIPMYSGTVNDIALLII